MAAHARAIRRKPAAERGEGAPSGEALFEHLVHDLRNPLGVIGYFAEVIPTAPAAERDELCERLRVNAQRALHVLEEFVLLADLRRGQSHLQPAPCGALELVDEVVSEVESIERRPGQTHRRVEPGMRLTASRPHVACAVRVLLREVLRASASEDGLDLEVCEEHGEAIFRLTALPRHDPDVGCVDRLPSAGIELELAERVAALHQGRLTIERLPNAGVITLALPTAV
jgi:signal transduction histidine kinase